MKRHKAWQSTFSRRGAVERVIRLIQTKKMGTLNNRPNHMAAVAEELESRGQVGNRR